MFYQFLKIQYQMGKITKEEIERYVPQFLTLEQVQTITGDKADD